MTRESQRNSISVKDQNEFQDEVLECVPGGEKENANSDPSPRMTVVLGRGGALDRGDDARTTRR